MPCAEWYPSRCDSGCVVSFTPVTSALYADAIAAAEAEIEELRAELLEAAAATQRGAEGNIGNTR
eukprot:4271441-Pyramimonas_sp.AAC.1